MKKWMLGLCLLLFVPSLLHAQESRQLTLEDIFDSPKFAGDSLWQAKWMPHADAFTFMKQDEVDSVNSICKHDVNTGEESIFIDGHTLYVPDTDSLLAMSGYRWSKNGSKILLYTRKVEVWRRSLKCAVYVYDVGTGSVSPVFEGEERISNARVSPDGSQVGYVYKNNIYTRNLIGGETRQWTDDGSEIIINGKFDWVYEEEFGTTQGWAWSPDGKKIAFWRMDQSPVPEFSWLDYNPLHQKLTTIRYPKPGENNSLVQIGVIDLETEETVWMDIGDETDIYIPRMKWTENPNLLSIQRLNRAQNRLELLLADVRTGKTKTILIETDTCWVDVHNNLFFLKKRERFVWTSEQDGYNHIYLYNLDGSMVRQLTEGEWEVYRVYGIGESDQAVYYSSNQEDITECHIYSVKLDGSVPKRLTGEPGWHKASFSDDFQYFIDSWSNIRTPYQWTLYAAGGQQIRSLVENDLSMYDEYKLVFPEFSTITTSDGVELQCSMIKPPDFDESRRYPVLVGCYGGPGGTMVRNSWRRKRFLWYNLFAQHGYIIFSMNNRGIGGNGKAWANLAYHNLAKWALHDHIEAAKFLGNRPFVNPERIGIWGWSFGGYLTLLAMTKGADYFSTGVSGAPLACWRLYDNIYTERYMGRPEDNPGGYDSASVFSYIEQLKGNLLIIHGMADDNVHVQNTMQFIEQLQAEGKQFDMMVYPGHDHSVRDKKDLVELHLYTLITRYILDNL